jgi:hypothetical protein
MAWAPSIRFASTRLAAGGPANGICFARRGVELRPVDLQPAEVSEAASLYVGAPHVRAWRERFGVDATTVWNAYLWRRGSVLGNSILPSGRSWGVGSVTKRIDAAESMLLNALDDGFVQYLQTNCR